MSANLFGHVEAAPEFRDIRNQRESVAEEKARLCMELNALCKTPPPLTRIGVDKPRSGVEGGAQERAQGAGVEGFESDAACVGHQHDAGLRMSATTFCAPASADTHPHSAESCCTAAKQHVGDAGIRLCDLSDVEQELDRAIRELGQCATKALFEGQPDTAREFSRRMYAAIKSRTKEHQARLTAAVEARIADELTFHGEWTREVSRTGAQYR